MKEIRDEISSVQDKIKDIKETNQFEVPRLIRYRFQTCYGTNVFTIIKSIDEFKISLNNKLWIIKNNIRYSKACINKCNELLLEAKWCEQNIKKIYWVKCRCERVHEFTIFGNRQLGVMDYCAVICDCQKN